jgi:hypothetical protein
LRDDRNADRALDANKLCADTRLARWPERSTWGAVPRGSAGNFKEWKGWNVGKMSLESSQISSQISSQEKDRTWNLAQVIEKQRRFLDVRLRPYDTHIYNIYIYYILNMWSVNMIITLWKTNIAMENHHF